MKKIIIILFMMLLIPNVYGYDQKDCEVFVLPQLGITHYQTCLQNPDVYESYYVYHDVSFYNGTTLLKTESIRDGEDATAPSNPTKVGYTFTGWSSTYSNVTSSKSIYAEFNINVYTVTFKDYNGVTLKTETVLHGNDATPPSVSRTGYSFTGWSGSYSNVTGSLTVIAEYEKESYEVTFYGFNNEILKTETVLYGLNATPPSIPTITGYEFSGWIGTYTNIKSNKPIYADYNVKSYTVDFVSDGVKVNSQVVEYGDNASAPSNPSKTGHTFIGWDKSYYNVTSNKTIYALFDINSYQVTFHGMREVLKTELVDYNENSIPPINYNVIGYDFLGWSDSYNNIKSDIDIYALYEIKQYTVTLKDYDGTLLNTLTVNHGDSVIQEDPIRQGYTFTNWSGSVDNITSDATLFAEYDVLTYTVNYYDYDNLLIKTEVVNYGESSTPPVITKEGYGFIGWDQSYDSVTTDKDIYPIFEQNTYTVTFKDYDGTLISSSIVNHGESIIVEDPVRVGYTFTNWSGSVENITSDATLFAEYEVITYTVNYYDYDNLLIKTEVVNYEQSSTPPVITKEGYGFIGWDQPYDSVKTNKDIYPIFDQNIYTVTFKDYDGTLINTSIVNHGESIIVEDPVRVGYTFTNWSGSVENITSDATLFAEYEVNTYTVNYYDYDNLLIKTEVVSYGESSTPPVISKVGYNFLGWDQSYDSVTSNLYIYGLFELKTYNVTLIDYDGTLINSLNVNHGESIKVEDPVRVGYTFTDWSGSLDNVIDNLSLIAEYEVNTYTVNYYDFDNSLIKTELVNYNESSTPPTISKEGYNFLGWNHSHDNVINDIEMYGLYEVRSYTVTLIDYDGTIIDNLVVNHGDSFEYTTPLREGYRFIEWSGATNIIDDTTLVAEYEAINYTVNFYNNNTLLDTITVDYNQTPTPPTPPIIEGMTFIGWDKDIGNVKSDIDVFTIYDSVFYDVTLMNYDGTILDTIKVKHGDDFDYVFPSREGYMFTGWSDSTKIISNITLFAEYELNQYKVNFYEGDNLLKTISVGFNEKALPPSPPIKKGKSFIGWDKDINKVTTDMDVYALYEYKEYKVTFMNYNMSILKTEYVTYGEDATPPIARKYGSMFTSWDGSYKNVTNDRTIIAKFDEIIFTVSFYNGVDLIKIDKVKLLEDSSLPTPPEKEGYSFSHWEGKYVDIMQDEVVYAVYTKEESIKEPDYYNVVFKDFYGEQILKIKVLSNEKANPPKLGNIEGYEFKGWDKSIVKVTSDLIVNPIYEIRNYKVNFFDYDNSLIKEEVVMYGLDATPPIVTREGYQFTGWDKDYKEVKDNLDVTAIYTNELYKLEFIDLNGLVIDSFNVSTNDVIEMNDPYHVGYIFTGWDKDFTNLTKDTIVTAQYTVKEEYNNNAKFIEDVRINQSSSKIKLLIDEDVEFKINYLQVNDKLISNSDFEVKSKEDGLFIKDYFVEIILKEDIELYNLQVISLTDTLTNKEYLYDLRAENKELVNNLYKAKEFKLSTEVTNIDVMKMWFKQLIK